MSSSSDRVSAQLAVEEPGTFQIPRKKGRGSEGEVGGTERTGREAGSASPECIIGLIVGF